MALIRVVAVAVNHLTREGFGIELQIGFDLFFNVFELRVELVVLRPLGAGEAVVGHGFESSQSGQLTYLRILKFYVLLFLMVFRE